MTEAVQLNRLLRGVRWGDSPPPPPRFSRKQLPLHPDKSCWLMLTVFLIFSNEAR